MSTDNSNLETEVREWVKGLRIILALVACLFLYYTVRALWAVPMFEKIFEDMLGSSEKIPTSTKIIIENWEILGGLLVAVSGLGIGFMLFSRRPLQACLALGLTIAFNVVAIHLIIQSLFMPLSQILKALSGND